MEQNRTDKKENGVKLYGVIIGIITALLQHGIYLGAYKLSCLVGREPILPKISAIDDLIPVIPLFVLPYVWSYIYWLTAPMAVSKCSKHHFVNYLCAYMLSCFVGAMIIVFLPTYMDRVAEGLYEIDGFGAKLLNFWYSLDGGETAYNLFPSFHCINSTVSYLGVMGRKEVPKSYRIYSLIITVLIYVSTVTVKQHYVLDVIGGIAVAVLCFTLCTKADVAKYILKENKKAKKLPSDKKSR